MKECHELDCKCLRCSRRNERITCCAQHSDVYCPDDPLFDSGYVCPDFVQKEEPDEKDPYAL